MSDVHPADVPGMEQAYAAVRRVGGILLTPDAARDLVLIVATVLRPHIQAEVFADLADDHVVTAVDQVLADAVADQGLTNFSLSHYLDTVSDLTRKGLTHGG